MTTGIRAEVSVSSPWDCPIARVTEGTTSKSPTVSRTAVPESQEVVEEFEVDRDVTVDESDFGDLANIVFTYGNTDVYRFTRSGDAGCACQAIETLGFPIVDAHARDGTLYLTFHAPDMDALGDAVALLREHYEHMGVERLVRSDPEHDNQDLVFVDRGSLTGRQLEVLTTAHDMGFFRHPKDANAGEVAKALGIATSTFTEHLAAAQSKLFTDILSST